jgi:hypothetical protein
MLHTLFSYAAPSSQLRHTHHSATKIYVNEIIKMCLKKRNYYHVLSRYEKDIFVKVPFCLCFIESLTSKVVTLSHHVHFYLVDSLAPEKNLSALNKRLASRSSLSEYRLASLQNSLWFPVSGVLMMG